MPEDALRKIDIPELRTPFLFHRKPVAIPADLRPAWRIGLIVLLLKNCCRGGRTSLSRLQVLSWGFRSAEGRTQLQAAVDDKLSPDALVVRFEPFLVQAIDFAVGEALLNRVGGNKLELTEAGLRLAEELETVASAFQVEKAFMATLRMRVSESFVNKMFGRRNQT
jgi:hypothetical protein